MFRNYQALKDDLAEINLNQLIVLNRGFYVLTAANVDNITAIDNVMRADYNPVQGNLFSLEV